MTIVHLGLGVAESNATVVHLVITESDTACVNESKQELKMEEENDQLALECLLARMNCQNQRPRLEKKVI